MIAVIYALFLTLAPAVPYVADAECAWVLWSGPRVDAPRPLADMEGPAVKRFVTAPSISWSMLTSEYLSGRHGRFPEDAGARLTMERLRRRIRLICAGCSEEQSRMTPLRRELPPSSRLRKKGMTTALLFSTRCARGPLSEWKDAQEPSRAADCGPRRDRPRRAETVPGRSRALGREGSNPDQVVRGEGKCKHPVHAAGAPVPRLAHQPDGFEPAEDLLHSLAPLLADRVARMPSGSIVNRAAAAMAGVLGDMGGHSEQAHRRDEIARVIALVGPEGEAPVAIQRPEQFERGGPFGVAAGGEHAAAGGPAGAVFHQHVAGVEELGFLPFAFAREPRVGIRCGRMGGVAAALAVEIHRRIARVIGQRRRRVPPFEAF